MGLCGLLALGTVVVVGGCRAARDQASGPGLGLDPLDPPRDHPITSGEERAALAAMRSAAPADRPPAGSGYVRGVSLELAPDAARLAGRRPSVQMAIVRTESLAEGGYLFTMKTFEGWPAELRVVPDSESVYRVADVSVGWFPETRTARADALEEAFVETMEALGEKRRLPDDAPR